MEIRYQFRRPAREGFAARQTIPGFPLGAVRLDCIMIERKRGLELREDQFRHGLVGRKNVVVLEVLDKAAAARCARFRAWGGEKQGFHSE